MAVAAGKEFQGFRAEPKPEQKLAGVAGGQLLVARKLDVAEFRKEQRELDALLLERALEEDRIA